jgi:hypothetical protein
MTGLGPLEVTEWLLAQRDSPRPKLSLHGRLSQARMWREYASTYDGRLLNRGFVGWPNGHKVIIGREWVEKVLCMSREELIRRARVSLYLASRINRDRREMAEKALFEEGRDG